MRQATLQSDAPGTDSETDELYGLTIDRVLVRRFNVGFHSRTLRNFAIMNSWFQDVDRAVELLGKNLVGRIAYSTFVHGAGAGGDGPKVGLTVGAHTYADGTVVPAEGLQVTFNQFYGFATGINLDFATVVNVIGNDFQAAVSGIEFTTVQQKLNITDNSFDMVGADVKYAIVGQGAGLSHRHEGRDRTQRHSRHADSKRRRHPDQRRTQHATSTTSTSSATSSTA